ncbi:MAG: ribosomal protein S18-alanine N-acetyltransferase [Lachnospira sp.]
MSDGTVQNLREYIIRDMTVEDIPSVELIEKSIFSLPWSAASFKDAIDTPNDIYLVCEADGKIAGYCGLWTVLGEGNITNMAVSEEFRRRGIAEKLMKEMERRGRELGVDTFFLEVRVGNTAARSLYKKMSYNEIGTRKRFYERPVEDAIVMSKICETE